jgi:hypothetical protein
MEGMVANNTGNYGWIDPSQFGDYSCKWRSLPEWIGCILVAFWSL